jgi:hypothetical protein
MELTHAKLSDHLEVLPLKEFKDERGGTAPMWDVLVCDMIRAEKQKKLPKFRAFKQVDSLGERVSV